MEFKKEDLIKSPLNYTGGKFKLLPQILPIFPDNINTFVDLFTGGCNVGINVNAKTIICNDIQKEVIQLLSDLKGLSTEQSLHILKNTIEKYQLSKTNEEGFKTIRNDYNKGSKSWDMFYAMVTNAFNYQIRFNKSGEYNMPFGRNRSSFNATLEQNFIRFVDELQNKNIKFICNDFRQLKPQELHSNDFVYADPPYLITCASYNESDGWNIECENDLLNIFDELHKNGVRFALSNVFESKGKVNEMLIKWSEKYIVHNLDYDYNNCNYHAIDKTKNKTKEVLITNYKIK